jgi:hypothetical protein
MLIDYQEIYKFLKRAAGHYEISAPTVANYCNDLHLRICRAQSVQLVELSIIQNLAQHDGAWVEPTFAASQIRKLIHHLALGPFMDAPPN